MTRIAQISSSQYSEPPILVTSVGRITEQKVRLFLHKMENGETALGELLNHLGDQGFFILVGSGDKKLEQSLTKIASIKSNFIFLKGYSDRLSNNLYDSGDLFLMPSSFEPCGISQMLAMRAGQVCLAHRVGGLRDTIEHEKNGLTFDGDTPAEQVSNMLRCFKEALALKRKNKKKWDRLAKNAAKSRFLWKDSAAKYIQDLYQKF